jgi:branched-chain amino acid transport system substrate-binding protein
MTKSTISRRGLLLSTGAAVGAGAFYGPWRHNRVYAAASDKPLKIGITSDASGQYANSGASDRRGMAMAIAEFNDRGGVLGRQVETVHLDTETTPATGSRVAERLIAREECTFLIGAVSSGVANAISQVAQKYGTVYLNTNSSSPTESGANCHRVKFVWDGNGANFAKAAVKNAIESIGKKWMLVTNDYVWGHNTAAATRKLVEAYGGEIVDEILVPQGTRDFSSTLLSVQQAGVDVVGAAVGGDDQKAMRQQVAQLGMGDSPAWINNQQDWPDVYGLPIDNLFGVFGTALSGDVSGYQDAGTRQCVLQRLYGNQGVAERR